jgi:hypothetical protein
MNISFQKKFPIGRNPFRLNGRKDIFRWREKKHPSLFSPEKHRREKQGRPEQVAVTLSSPGRTVYYEEISPATWESA